VDPTIYLCPVPGLRMLRDVEGAVSLIILLSPIDKVAVLLLFYTSNAAVGQRVIFRFRYTL
jgi:hypothetical protein